jgi:LPS export ABC transporter protein LptC
MPHARFGAAIAAAAWAALSLAGCSFNYEGANQPAQSVGPNATFRDFSHSVVIDGAKALDIKAALAESWESEKRIVLHDVSFTEYKADGISVEAEGRADEAVFYTDTENADFSGSIRMRYDPQDAGLVAERLSWDAKSKTLSGGLERSVEVRRGDGTWMRGAGFSADARRLSFSFRESVEGVVVAKDEEKGPTP